ncbi:MAG: hypothetical protein AB7O24_02970 [Kofleriaceae bacterium]
MALEFRNSEALQVVLRSALCPAGVVQSTARIARRPDGALVLAPDAPLPAPVLATLRDAGIATDSVLPNGARAIRCWAEAIEPIQTPVATIPSLVLFVTKAAELIDLAAELVRLGCDRQELLVTGELGVIRVVDPPTYTVVRAIDHEAGLQVFSPDPLQQEAVWSELGSHHPLADQLRGEAGTLLLISANGWFSIANHGWFGLDAALDLSASGGVTLAPAERLPERRKVLLRLAHGQREPPSLWVVRSHAIAEIDRLLEYLPEEIVARLTFAATGGPEPTIIVRARTGRQAPPDLALDAEQYSPLAQLPDVYAPTGTIVEPPLRRERLRSILHIEQGELVWLARVGAGRSELVVERISDRAFSPLSDWADYVIHANAPALLPWTKSATFDFASYVSTGLEWSERPVRDPAPAAAAPSAAPDAKKRSRARSSSAAGDQNTATRPSPSPALRAEPGPVEAATLIEPVSVDPELVAIETEFLALDGPGDARERLGLFERLAHGYARARRSRDANLCFSRIAWEAPADRAPALLDEWIAATVGPSPRAVVEHVLVGDEPSIEQVGAVAVVAARGLLADQAHAVQRWLDEHDHQLDARSVWLSRLALARQAGGDALGLAHARDRVLARMTSGLSVDREMPSFLRFAGRADALGSAGGERLEAALEQLTDRIAKTRRKRSPLEAPVELTNAYVALIFGYGFARLGREPRARSLVAAAMKVLSPLRSDAVHGYLVAAFVARIDQAVASLPAETPLPDALGAQLATLERLARYKVDRLRDASRILEPVERPDAFGAFTTRGQDSRGPEFAALRTLTDTGARAKAVEGLVVVAAANEPERARLLDGIFDVLLGLPEAVAAPTLDRSWPLVERVEERQRAVLYAEALVVAGHFGRTTLIPQLLARLAGALGAVDAPDLERVLHQSLRALRRIGLRREMTELLANAERAVPVGRGDALRGRLALAGGLAFLGEVQRATPIFEQARAALGDNLAPAMRLELARSLALAYSQAPVAVALQGIGELSTQLRDVTDGLGTNSHFCLSVLHFVESLVLGVTSEDLALGEPGRRFVEDDEYLIRRRLHRDLGDHT